MASLPLSLEPVPDESWVSYLTRQAAQHQTTIGALADFAGLRDERDRWPGYFGLRIEPGRARTAASRLGLTVQQVQAMQLDVYDGRAFDLACDDHDGAFPAVRAIAARHWVRLAGSAYCPTCLDEDGVWRLRWRIPWSVTCPNHGVFLVDLCPGCGHRPQTAGGLRGSAPTRSTGAADTRRCGHPVGDDLCRHQLSSVPTTPAPTTAIERDLGFIEMLAANKADVAGTAVRALDAVAAWQATASLAVSLGVVTIEGWGPNRGVQPPPDAIAVHSLLQAAEPVIAAPSAQSAALVIADWTAAAGIATPYAGHFPRSVTENAALKPVIQAVLAKSGRTHTRLRRHLGQDAPAQLPLFDWDVDDVPQLVWPCALPEHLWYSTRPDERILRAVIAMMLVRMREGSASWAEAGLVLGMSENYAKNWTRYVVAPRFGLRDVVVDVATTLAPMLSQQVSRHSFGNRPGVDGHGAHALKRAQAPLCTLSFRGPTWCPCQGSRLYDRQRSS